MPGPHWARQSRGGAEQLQREELKQCSRDPLQHDPEWGGEATVKPSLEENCQVDKVKGTYCGAGLSVWVILGRLSSSLSMPHS